MFRSSFYGDEVEMFSEWRIYDESCIKGGPKNRKFFNIYGNMLLRAVFC